MEVVVSLNKPFRFKYQTVGVIGDINDLLNEELSEEFNLSEVDEDTLFEEYMALTEEIAVRNNMSEKK